MTHSANLRAVSSSTSLNKLTFASKTDSSAQEVLEEIIHKLPTAARKRGVVFGRGPGQRGKADRYAPKVLKLVGEGSRTGK